MGWFSGIGDALGGVGSWLGSNADWLVPAVTTVGGALLGSDANADALKAQQNANADAQEENSDAQNKARAELAAAKQRGIRAIQAGTSGYRDTINPMLEADYGPTGLTDSQGIQLEDLTRYGNASIAASGLRGAGRAGPLAVMETRRRFMADSLGTNQQRQDSARRGLAGIYADEGKSIANTEIGTGSQTASSLQGEGATNANLAVQSGQAAAGAATANGSLWSDTLGSLAGIADDALNRARTDKYGRPTAT